MNMKVIISLFILFLSFHALSQNYLVSSVTWSTEDEVDDYTQKQLEKLIGTFESKQVIKDFINEAIIDLGLKQIRYQVIQSTQDESYNVHFEFQVLPRVSTVEIKGELPNNINSRLYVLRTGDYLTNRIRKDSIESFENALVEGGYPKAKVTIIESQSKVGTKLVYHIKLGTPLLLREIRILGGDSYLKQFYRQELSGFENKPINMTEIRLRKDEVDMLMKDHGYYSLKTKLSQTNTRGDLILEINHIGPFVFNIKNNKRFSTFRIKRELKEKMTFAEMKVAQGIAVKIIENLYLSAGYYDTSVEIKQTLVQTIKKNQTQVRFEIDIKEGHKVYIYGRDYKGNFHIKDSELEELFEKYSTSLASNNMLDEDFYESFPDLIKKYYGERGYLLSSTRVKIPYVERKDKNIKDEPRNVDIIIVEGVETIIQDLKIVDVYDADISTKELKEKIINKIEKPLNPYVISDDVKIIASYYKDLGYFRAKVVNENHSNLVNYSKDARQAELSYVVERGNRYSVKNVFVFGNEKTKDKLIQKRLVINKGDYLTPKVIDDFKRRLFALGLFSSVSVYPRQLDVEDAVEGSVVEIDLIVRVKEIDYGKIELIPGLRSDFGVKLGFNIGYSNMGGMGRSLRFNSEINQRLNYNVFDKARNAEDDKFLEYRFNLGYTELDVFKTDVSYLAEVGVRKRRYFAFDASVGRIANTFSYKFVNNLRFSMGHQYEKIKQFNGSTPDDNGEFQIGSILPEIAFDWRDSFTNPLKGGLHKLNVEWADPLWFSQSGSGETISFVKYVLRNRFYIPYKNGTLALGWTLGVQNNLDDGFIPGIKTFRLTGADLVRGFSDEEINRLNNSEDISQFKVEDKAYLNSLKVEPRFYINDNVMLGVFWDAGRVTVDREEFFNLRQSVGLSFRVITPVGSINFDYGYKLDRKEYSTGEIESPGRFHLSIGLF